MQTHVPDSLGGSNDSLVNLKDSCGVVEFVRVYAAIMG